MLHDFRHIVDVPSVSIAVLTVFANAVGGTCQTRAVALAVLFPALRALAAAAPDNLEGSARRAYLLVLDLEVRALKCKRVVHTDAADSVDPLLLVPAVVVAVVADAVFTTSHVVAEALAVLLQAFGPPAPAPAVLTLVVIAIVFILPRTMLRLGRRIEETRLLHNSSLRSTGESNGGRRREGE